MGTIQILDKEFVVFLSKDEIQSRIEKLAAEINADYKDKRPIFVSVLNGAFVFTADLFKHITVDCEVCFIKLASYKGTQSTGHVVTAIGLDVSLKDRHVIVVEDIVDTGQTLHHFLPQLYHQHPATLKIAVLLHKPEARKFDFPIDYCCYQIENKFVVGYGLDYDGLGRNLPEIYQLKD